MFIYFPELAYKQLTNYFKYTFNNSINENSSKEIISKKLKNENFQNLISQFKENNISLPSIELNHCNSLFKFDMEADLSLVSYYDRIENKIKMCRNLIKNEFEFSRLVDKELTYCLELNKLNKERVKAGAKNKNKLNSLNDLAEVTIKACRNMIRGDYFNFKEDFNLKLENELIRRCSYGELKYKFALDIKSIYEEEFPEMDNLKLNEIVRKLTDQNLR